MVAIAGIIFIVLAGYFSCLYIEHCVKFSDRDGVITLKTTCQVPDGRREPVTLVVKRGHIQITYRRHENGRLQPGAIHRTRITQVQFEDRGTPDGSMFPVGGLQVESSQGDYLFIEETPFGISKLKAVRDALARGV